MRSAGENSIQAASPGTGAQKGHLLCMDSLSNPRNLLPVPSFPFYKQPDVEEAKILRSGVQGVVLVEIPLERCPIERFSLERMLIFRALYQIVTNHCHAHLDQSDLP